MKGESLAAGCDHQQRDLLLGAPHRVKIALPGEKNSTEVVFQLFSGTHVK